MAADQSVDIKHSAIQLIDECFQTGQLDRLPEFFAMDYVDHSFPPGFPGGVEGAKLGYKMFREAFPDFVMTLHDVVADGNTVVTRRSYKGTHRGPFMGYEGTGRHVEWMSMDLSRFEGGKIVERWAVRDDLSILRSIGVI